MSLILNSKKEVIIKKSQLTALQEAKLIAELADDKKAEDIVILDMRKVVNFCDYFVIASGVSERQVLGIAYGIEEGLHKLGINVRYKEGVKSSNWFLIDLGDVVVHIFESQVRDFYGLEHLWQDALKVQWKKKILPKKAAKKIAFGSSTSLTKG